ncbi:MAG: hypothetical protein ACYCPO_06620 [Acidobacteriaceae bacterium]
MSRFIQIAQQVGELVERKNAAYGDSIATAGAALRLLYPNGIAPEQMDDALLVGRIWDKLKRVATDRDAFGESPYIDIAGYSILGIEMHRKKEKHVAPTAGVSPSVPKRGMHANRKARSGQVLQRRLPDEGLSRSQGPQAC